MPQLDKYAPYVLASYGVAVVIVVGLVVFTAYRLRRARARLAALEADGKDAAP